MSYTAIVNITGLVLNLAGFLVLVREVRYAHLTEYHNVNLDEAVRKAKQFKADPGAFIKQSAIQMFGEKVVNAFGIIPDEKWQEWAEEKKHEYADQLNEAIRYAAEWKRKVPAAALKLRMRWLTVGASKVVVGVLLQALSTVMQMTR